MYDMQDFADECVKTFCALSGFHRDKLRPAWTPFIDESKDPVQVLADEDAEGTDGAGFRASGAAKDAGSRASGAATGGTRASGAVGELADISCKCLMKVMYMARFGSFDLQRAVGALGTRITKWDLLGDKKLLRLMRCIHATRDWKQIGFVGDPIESLSSCAFSPTRTTQAATPTCALPRAHCWRPAGRARSSR